MQHVGDAAEQPRTVAHRGRFGVERVEAGAQRGLGVLAVVDLRLALRRKPGAAGRTFVGERRPAGRRSPQPRQGLGSAVGVTAGASAPEDLVQGVVQKLKALGAVSVRSLDGVRETTKFPLPKGLKVE